jgi:phage terminase large subunit
VQTEALTTGGLDLSIARSRFRTFNENAAQGAPVIEQEVTPAFHKPQSDFTCYGGARELWNLVVSGESQVMIHGPAETGKTISALNLIDWFCWNYSGLQVAMIRKVAADLWGSIIHDFEKSVINMPEGENETASGITKYGGQKPEHYLYPTKSKIWVGGMDHPGKILSAQRDIVYFNQAEEAELNDWETISTRTTGRAGVLRPGRLIGDCNPGPSTHWIIALAEAGTLKMVKSYHQDNPTLFNPQTGEITAQGKISIGNLDKLTGVRYKRLRKGEWVAAEGVVYETWDPTVHANRLKTVAPIIYYFASVDWGLKNPGVIQVWGVDGDARMYRVEEVYQTGKLVAASKPEDAWWVNKAKELQKKWNIKTFVPDPSRPDHIEVFENAGLDITPAYNPVDLGVQNVESRLVVQPDGYPRLMLMAGSKDPDKDPALADKHLPSCLEEEMEVYSYPKDKKTGTFNKKENPVEKDNHACDAARYACAFVDQLGENQFIFGRS